MQPRTPWKPLSSATTSIRSVSKVISLSVLLCAASVRADLLSTYQVSDAPLSGQIWNLNTETFTTPAALFEQLEPGSWLFLGETHENVDHHSIQTLFIEQLAERGQMGALALEMANIEQQPLLDSASSDPTKVTPEQLEWHRGWPWDWYKGPVTAGLKHAKRVVATDLTRSSKMAAYGDESLEVPADSAYTDFMLDLLYEGHCGQMPKSQLTNMLRVQYARDISMREAMIANTDESGVNILLAGTVHTRYDIGIPYWTEELNIRTLLMVAANDNPDPKTYYPDSYADTPVADFILFTPPTEYENGCN